MSLHFLFSKKDKLGSKLISWASEFEQLTHVKKAPSHVAVLIDDSIVIESTGASGIRMVPYMAWKKFNQQMFKIPYKFNRADVKLALQLHWGKKYDYGGIAYFVWRFLGLILFKKPMPSKNRLEKHNKYFCTEFAGMIVNDNLSMKTPAKFCDELLERQ